MESEQLAGKLLSRYDAIRRQELDEITGLLDTLGRVENLPDAQMEQVRDALFHTNHPFLMVMVGPFSSGKSSIINALLGEQVMDVGPVPTTDHIAILRHGPDVQRSRSGDVETVFHPNPLLENLSLVDTPGLESIFRSHEEITRRFLHRADVVLLVMPATQVLSASNLEHFQQLKAYGKRVVIVVNQVDVLDGGEREQVRDFVLEQSRLHLGVEPKIWLVSAKQALAAQQETPRDEILWDQSGFADIEEYIKETLVDVERFRQKLETPLQICQNVTRDALASVNEQQAVIDAHRKTTENIEAQIEQARREQQHTVNESLKSIEGHWNDAIARGDEAIADLFHFSRGLSLFFSGLGELLGISRLLRRFRGQTRAENAFEEHKVDEALQQIPKEVDKLGPRLEGRDLQDIDDLVTYTRDAVKALPPTLSDKVIGRIQTPLHYERGFLRDVSGQLDDLIQDAGRFETKRLDRTLRNWLIVLALWEVLTIALVLVVAVSVFSNATPEVATILLVFGVGILFVVLGMALVPLRGWFLRRAYQSHLREDRDQYLDILRRASGELIAHGVQLRHDATAPFTRLIDSQAELVEDLRTDLEAHQQTLMRIQRDLAGLAESKQPA
ncbi:dynamin family protein [Aggregatilinea lenta]|uniref:dynamin family protein n=1 Tax=Aggregatilinea lenta TaxID=913108 RepID=UPI000E5AA2BF|nr:dynamin family protein [Aggregatilinea lenta]